MISEFHADLLTAAAKELELLASNRTQTPDLALVTQAIDELGEVMSSRDYPNLSRAARPGRLASKQAAMRDRWTAAPDRTASQAEVARLWSPGQLAEQWSLSVDTVRRLFEREAGVLVIGTERYRTLRIPQEVVDRVRRKREIVC